MEFIANPKAKIDQEAAEVLGSRFLELAGSGDVTPERVVDDARPVDSPTHPYFEWNDVVAAEEWRKSQAAHYLLNIVVVDVEADDPLDMASFVYHDVPQPEVLTMHDLADTDSERVVARAREELLAWQARYNSLYDVRPALPWIREALQALGHYEMVH